MLQASSLVVPEIDPRIKIAHSGLEVGNTDPRFGEAHEVREARAAVREGIGLSSEATYVIVPRGGIEFVDVDAENDPEKVKPNDEQYETDVFADALVTGEVNTGLMLNSADCTPVAVFDPESNILALIHMGWRGAVHNFHEIVLGYAQESRGFDPEMAIAYLGPSIQQSSYKTEKLHDAQESEDEWKPHISEGEDGFYIDLPGFISEGMVRAGVNPNNVHQSPIDTGAFSSGHFSFTRHKNEGTPNGRNGFVVAMQG